MAYILPYAAAMTLAWGAKARGRRYHGTHFFQAAEGLGVFVPWPVDLLSISR